MKPKYHELAGLFPEMTKEALAALTEDIRKNGLIEPIVKMKGQIIDGKHREEACRRAGRRPKYVEFEGKDPVAFVVSKNLSRRHLTDNQRAMVAANIANMREGRPAKTSSNERVSEKAAAKLLNVSPARVKRAKKVKAKGTPELVKAVEAGEVPVSTAAEIADKPKAEQPEAIKEHAEKKPKPKVLQLNKGARKLPGVRSTEPPLNGLAWAEASPELRAKWIDDVGVKSIFEAMNHEQRDYIAGLIVAALEAREAAALADAAPAGTA